MRGSWAVDTSSTTTMGSVTTLDSLQALRITIRCSTDACFRLHRVALVETSRRKEPGAENRGGHEIDQRDAGPHQGGRPLLIIWNRKTKMTRNGKVRGVDNTVREHKKSGENVARQRGKKEV